MPGPLRKLIAPMTTSTLIPDAVVKTVAVVMGAVLTTSLVTMVVVGTGVRVRVGIAVATSNVGWGVAVGMASAVAVSYAKASSDKRTMVAVGLLSLAVRLEQAVKSNMVIKVRIIRILNMIISKLSFVIGHLSFVVCRLPVVSQ